MTQRIGTVPLDGGPSAGNGYRPETKWPMYLNAEGWKIQASLGDRIVNGRSAVKGCYVLQRVDGVVTGYNWVSVL